MDLKMSEILKVSRTNPNAKPVEACGQTFPSRNAFYAHASQITGRTFDSVSTQAQLTKLEGDALVEYLRTSPVKSKPVEACGQTFPSRNAFYAHASQITGRTFASVESFAQLTKLEGDALVEYLRTSPTRFKPVEACGQTFPTRNAFYAHVARITGRTPGSVRSWAQTNKLEGDALLKHIRASSISVDGKLYPTGLAFAQAYGLDIRSVNRHLAAGNSPTYILERAGKLKKAPAAGKRPTVAGKSAVQMSGWVWNSFHALLQYYGAVAKGPTVREAMGRGKTLAFAMYPILANHYVFGNLRQDNRLTPEREALIPPNYLPIDQPRLTPLNLDDRQATPDWAVMPPGAVHDFEGARQAPSLAKTMQALRSGHGGARRGAFSSSHFGNLNEFDVIDPVQRAA
jgi:hypothetical protein